MRLGNVWLSVVVDLARLDCVIENRKTKTDCRERYEGRLDLRIGLFNRVAQAHAGMEDIAKRSHAAIANLAEVGENATQDVA